MIKKRRHEKLQDYFSRFALQWFEYLATGRYEEAAQMLDGQESVGYRWEEDEICRVLVSIPEVSARIMLPSESTGDPEVAVYPTMEGLGYHFDHPLPINGQWSNLIVRFVFERTPDGYKSSVEDIEEAD